MLGLASAGSGVGDSKINVEILKNAAKDPI